MDLTLPERIRPKVRPVRRWLDSLVAIRGLSIVSIKSELVVFYKNKSV